MGDRKVKQKKSNRKSQTGKVKRLLTGDKAGAINATDHWLYRVSLSSD